MTDLDFEYLRGYLKQRSGLALTAEKRYLVESRLAPVCRRFTFATLHDLIVSLRLAHDGVIERAVVEAMTTNETFFFRDRIPFDMFRDVVLPEAIVRNAARRRLRIWCAAASTGQEPYSLAMLLQEAAPRLAGWQIDLVATDISTEVLEKAKLGLYSQFEVQRGLPVAMLLRYFRHEGERFQISDYLRAKVSFRVQNLMAPPREHSAFDMIFCRNVLIYFDAPTKAEILGRFAGSLAPGGSLLLGAAETVIGLTERLSPHTKHRGLYTHAEPARPAALKAVG